MKIRFCLGDCAIRIKSLADESIDAVVSDPPYEIGFMSKAWDNKGVAFSKDLWEDIFRVLAPGGIVKVFGGTRTFHRMAAVMADVGFSDIRLEAWVYASGFPKSLNVGKKLDQMEYARRERTLRGVLAAGGHADIAWRDDDSPVIETIALSLDGEDVSVLRTGDKTFVRPVWLTSAQRSTQRFFHSGEVMMRHGGDNTRPWIEKARQEGYHDAPGAIPATDRARLWQGWGTALKPAWEPILTATKPAR